MKMDKAQEIAQRIAYMMKGNGVSSLDVSSHDRFGIDHPIVLNGGDINGEGYWENFEVYTLHITMFADTNMGKVDLLEVDRDEIDWKLLENEVKDVLGY